MNDDGCDEIGYFFLDKIFYDGRPSVSYYCCRILCGNTVNDTIPDYEYEVSESLGEINPLGDINGDGYADAGITECRNNILTYSIVYGGSFEKVTFVDGIYTRNGKGFRGLGDVNGDGFDDFSYYFQNDHIEQPGSPLLCSFHNRFFYGSTVQDTMPDYRLDYYSTVNLWYELYPAGDWNGDGYDDFVLSGYDVPEDGSTSPGCRLWRGGATLHWDWFGHIEYYSIFVPAYGDLNGDGKGDLVDSFVFMSGICGYIYVYLGDQNGTKDFSSSTYEEGYGSGCAVGDFDNDGYDDIAIGAFGDEYGYPPGPNNYGNVFVYGGHEDLVEQDSSIVDPVHVPPVIVTVKAYPNPFNPNVSFHIMGNKILIDLNMAVYNIKGQKIDSIPTSEFTHLDGNDPTANSNSFLPGESRGREYYSVTWNAEGFPSGIYICQLSAGDKHLSTLKVTQLK